MFVCVKNGGKSQIAAALMRHLAGDAVEVFSAGTAPGGALNAEAADAVAEVGATFEGESSRSRSIPSSSPASTGSSSSGPRRASRRSPG